MRGPIFDRLILSRWLRGALFAACALTLAACGEDAPEPAIEDRTIPWLNPQVPRDLTARVRPLEGWEIVSVYVRHTRHYWPGAQTAHDASAQPVPGSDGVWRVTPQEPKGARQGDRLYYRWFVDLRLEDGGTEILTLSTRTDDEAPHDFVVGCTEDDTAATIEQIRQVMNGLRPQNGRISDNPGYAVASHFASVSLKDQGVPYATQMAALNLSDVSLDEPDLVIYAPRPKAAGETDAAYFSAITDAIDDEPYTLIGVGYGQVQTDIRRRPSLGCIPSDQWFVHEAGWHTLDGGMLVVDVPEDYPGAREISALQPPPEFASAMPPFASAWHPRIWDLHLWTVDNGAGTPVLSVAVPGGLPGIELGPEPPFFQSQTFE